MAAFQAFRTGWVAEPLTPQGHAALGESPQSVESLGFDTCGFSLPTLLCLNGEAQPLPTQVLPGGAGAV